tara:strand:+ start:348 stop:560 length:213 start_codon:yes stop_codon:yes gene_type:complete
MWAGAEPLDGIFNQTYFSMLKEIIHEGARYDIYFLLDMHQDLLSEWFCGEGVPPWLVENYMTFSKPLNDR